jgi:hypothetical protein
MRGGPPPLITPDSSILSQALTFPGFALTHCSAAFSGFIFLPAMRFATKFWSLDVHFQFLTNLRAVEPLVANFFEMSLSRP